MGLIAAGQMRAGGAGPGRAVQAVKIGIAGGGRPGTDAVGDAGDCGIQGHRLPFCAGL